MGMRGNRETWRSYKNTKRSNNKGEYRWRWRNKSGGNNNKLEYKASGHNGVHNNDGVVSEKNHDGGATAAESAAGEWARWGRWRSQEPGAGRETRPRPRQGQHGRNIIKTKGIFSSRTRRQGCCERGKGMGREGKGMAATGGNGDRRTGATTHETAQNARWPLQVLKCFRLRGCLPTTAT